jgi:arylsulfatase A-like enzyme
MNSDAAKAFDLSNEPTEVREAYGRGLFGQGCLMARRLIEQGVPFVEVSLNGANGAAFGWDTHANNFEQVRQLSGELDAGWATLMKELDERGLLESTTIIWMGEFGRTPSINANVGRDHFPQAWTCVFGGGGIAGGQVYGRTSADGMSVEEGKVGVSDVLATLCQAVGVPPRTENISDSGRPLPIVDGEPIREILA